MTNDKALTSGTDKQKPVKTINYFWFGFLAYSLSYTLSTSDSVSYIACQALQLLGLGSMFPAAFMLMKWKFETSYLKTVFIIYICWLIIIILRGLTLDYRFIKFLLFDGTFGIFIYFVPLIILLPRDLKYLKKVFDIVVILGLAYVMFDFVFIRELLFQGRNLKSQAIIEYFSQHLSLPAGFILLTYVYHTRKRVTIALFVIFLNFLFAAIRARRGLMFMSLNILVFSYFIYYYANKVKLIIFIISILFISGIYIAGAKIYNKNRSGIFGYVTDRLDENTRTGVEYYFYSDMRTVDWLVGRGMNGEYYCPGIDSSEGVFTVTRGVIETGYLQIILKGGIISLLLLLLIAIPAAFKGIFRSKNILSKAAGMWILLFMMNLYPATPTIFGMYYLLVWISIGICYSEELRNMPEKTLKEAFSAQQGISGL
jgi:hypothetical protein